MDASVFLLVRFSGRSIQNVVFAGRGLRKETYRHPFGKEVAELSDRDRFRPEIRFVCREVFRSYFRSGCGNGSGNEFRTAGADGAGRNASRYFGGGLFPF